MERRRDRVQGGRGLESKQRRRRLPAPREVLCARLLLLLRRSQSELHAGRSGAERRGTAQDGAWIGRTHARTHALSPCLLHVPAGSPPTRPMLDAQRGRAEIPPVTDEPWTVRAAAARSWWSGTRSVARRRCCMCSPRTATQRCVSGGLSEPAAGSTTCEGHRGSAQGWKLEVETFT